MRRLLVYALVGAVMLSCGGPSGTRPTPTGTPGATATATAAPSPPNTSTPTPQPSPIATQPVIAPGACAYVTVTVATLWRNPDVVRSVDAAALQNPVRIRDWLAAMTWSQKADLIDRADSQVLLGDRVIVLSLRAGWAQVVVPDQPTPIDGGGYPGWIPLAQLSSVAPPLTAAIATVISPSARLETSTGETVEISFGTHFPLLRPQGTSFEVGLPAGLTGTIPQASVTTSPAGTLPTTAASVMTTARQFVGLPYLWAGTSGFGFDCSGLVYLVYRTHGVRLPRDADAQATAGRPVDRSSLQAGDLVFFGGSATTIHHVAMYAGNGSILESPQTGVPVRLVPLSSYGDFYTARHVLP